MLPRKVSAYSAVIDISVPLASTVPPLEGSRMAVSLPLLPEEDEPVLPVETCFFAATNKRPPFMVCETPWYLPLTFTAPSDCTLPVTPAGSTYTPEKFS